MKGLQAVRAFLADHAPDVEIVELDVGTSTQTVPDRLGVLPGQVANTLVLDVKGRQVLAVTSGGTRLDNKKVKAVLGGKAKMMDASTAAEITGHEVGGISAVGLAHPMDVYCDVRLKEHGVVVQGAGAPRFAFLIDPLTLASLAGASWVDICRD